MTDAQILDKIDTEVSASARVPELTIVVPTFNERDNVFQLVESIDQALTGVAWEIVFVDDDSPDGTADTVRTLALKDPRVRILQRIGRRGLSSACIEGFLSSSAPNLAVMDGDLQHDETVLPQMLDKLREGSTDLVVGTRYALGGSVGEWDASRQRMSHLATRICKLMTGVSLSDPMSGFFMMRRDAFHSVARDLSGIGFKILLDIAATGKGKLRVAEVPFTFAPRHAGESKLDSMILWEFLMLLLDKKFGWFIPARFLSFAFIGAFGVVVHFLVLMSLYHLVDLAFIWAEVGAVTIAMISNFALNNVLTYRDRRKTGWKWLIGLASFMGVCSVGAVANVGIAHYLYSGSTFWALAALAGILVGLVWNYALTAVYTWKK
nr:glycosyltransferase family 2 protein [Hyphomonas sp. Mor2]